MNVRIQSLELLRGIAALQVVLLHLFSAFVPAIVFGTAGPGGLIHKSPLFYLYDGYSAVYVFFFLSGFVLTRPFTRDAGSPLAVIGARWVRLALPAAAACLFAAVLMVIWPNAHLQVARLTGSTWLADLWRVPAGAAQLLRDATANALFTGYREVGALASLGQQDRAGLQPVGDAYVVPLWTLSVEFYGSALVLGLAAIRRFAPRIWPLAMVVAAMLLFRTAYLCFVVGHFLAVIGMTAKPVRAPAALCAAGLAAGILLCVGAEGHPLPPAETVCRLPAAWMLPCDDAYQVQKIFGALLVFLSVTQWDAARRFLSHPRLALFGRLSFPIYLVHWPLVLGFGCFVYMTVLPEGAEIAAATAVAAGLLVTLFVALAFTHVDLAAQRLSHVLRDLARRRSEASPTAVRD